MIRKKSRAWTSEVKNFFHSSLFREVTTFIRKFDLSEFIASIFSCQKSPLQCKKPFQIFHNFFQFLFHEIFVTILSILICKKVEKFREKFKSNFWHSFMLSKSDTQNSAMSNIANFMSCSFMKMIYLKFSCISVLSQAELGMQLETQLNWDQNCIFAELKELNVKSSMFDMAEFWVLDS